MTDTNQDTPAPRPSVLASRRQFIQFGLTALGAAWAGTLAQSRLFPPASAQEAGPVEFALSELPEGTVKYITYAGAPAVVIRTAESVKAYSLICTHLGCTVQWQEGKQEFYCACHDGRFDQFGEVISGPPPVPLEQFPVTVDGSRVIVGELV